MQCVILAGGLGTRMSDFTRKIPKALIKVNKIPFVIHQLNLLKQNGINNILFSIGYLGGMIRDCLEDRFSLEMDIQYVDEGENLLGTGGALRLALTENRLDKEFMVLYGDSYLPVDYQEIIRAFHNTGKPALMTVFKNRNQWDSSNVIYKNGRIILYDKLKRDRRAEQMTHIDYGLAILTHKLVEKHIPEGQVYDLADLYYKLSNSDYLAAFEVSKRFYEIGSPEGLQELSEFLEQTPV